MRVLVCGSRDFTDTDIVEMILDGVLETCRSHNRPLIIIEGGARGADDIAGEWVEGTGEPVKHECYPADWNRHGKAAGILRNRVMLEEGKPDCVLAFIDKPLEESRGTAHMVSIAQAAGLPVYVIRRM